MKKNQNARLSDINITSLKSGDITETSTHISLNDIEAAFGICKPKPSASLQDIEEAIRNKASEE